MYATTRVIKLSLEILSTPTKVLPVRCSWAGKFHIIRPLRVRLPSSLLDFSLMIVLTPPPSQVMAVSSSALRVTWEPPPQNTTHGTLLGYHLGHKLGRSVYTSTRTHSHTAQSPTLRLCLFSLFKLRLTPFLLSFTSLIFL